SGAASGIGCGHVERQGSEAGGEGFETVGDGSSVGTQCDAQQPAVIAGGDEISLHFTGKVGANVFGESVRRCGDSEERAVGGAGLAKIAFDGIGERNRNRRPVRRWVGGEYFLTAGRLVTIEVEPTGSRGIRANGIGVTAIVASGGDEVKIVEI